jgi:hypothetical protein
VRSHLMLCHASTRISAPRHFATRRPHESRSSALRDSRIPLCHLYSTHAPLWPTLLQLSGYRYLATSRNPHPNSRTFSCEVPRHDPSLRSNGPPVLRIQRLSFSRFLATSRLGVPKCWTLNLRAPELARSVDLSPPVLLRWTATISSFLRRLASSRLATLHTQYLGLYLRTPEFARSPISATCPTQMDGSQPLATFVLVTSRLATFNPSTWAFTLRASELARCLDP